MCGDGEYIIYTALAWRSKTYGKALDFSWNSHDLSNACTFAIRESQLSVKIFKNFDEHLQIDLIYQADKIFAGALLGIKLEGCISFYDWEHGKLVRRVDLDDDIRKLSGLITVNFLRLSLRQMLARTRPQLVPKLVMKHIS